MMEVNTDLVDYNMDTFAFHQPHESSNTIQFADSPGAQSLEEENIDFVSPNG